MILPRIVTSMRPIQGISSCRRRRKSPRGAIAAHPRCVARDPWYQAVKHGQIRGVRAGWRFASDRAGERRQWSRRGAARRDDRRSAARVPREIPHRKAPLGAGGMGAVYEAGTTRSSSAYRRREGPSRRFAKRRRTASCDFLREGEGDGQVRLTRNVMRVYDAGVAQERGVPRHGACAGQTLAHWLGPRAPRTRRRPVDVCRGRSGTRRGARRAARSPRLQAVERDGQRRRTRARYRLRVGARGRRSGAFGGECGAHTGADDDPGGLCP